METILRLFLGFLADYIIAFFKNFREARLDNPKLWETAEIIIQQISEAHPEWPGEQKRSYAFDAIKVAGRELLKDLGDAAIDSLRGAPTAIGELADNKINTMIELIVQKLKVA